MTRPSPLPSHADAVIVGARAAGAATARLLAARGLRVLAIDKGRYGADTLSTHALMRPAVWQLHRWGLLPRVRAAGTPPVRTTTFHYGDEVLTIPVQPRDGVDALYAPRRTVLDRVLVDAAREAGATVRFAATFVDVLRDADGRVRGVCVDDGATGERREVHAELVIGADGRRSRVAERVGAEVVARGPGHSAGAYGYFAGLDVARGYHWHYAPELATGAIPTNDGLTCLFVNVRPRRLAEATARASWLEAWRALLAEGAPALAAAVQGQAPVGGLRPIPAEPGYLRRGAGPGWALVGDAGYLKDPLTAHGLTDALRDAELLAHGFARRGAAGLEDYVAARDALSTEFLRLAGEVASFDWDLPRVQALHRRMNDLMREEHRALRALEDPHLRAA